MTKAMLTFVLVAQVAIVFFDWQRTTSQTASQNAFIEKVQEIEACR